MCLAAPERVVIDTPAGKRLAERLTCSGCGTFLDIPAATKNGRLPHSVVHKKALQSGWAGTKKPLCPDCQS